MTNKHPSANLRMIPVDRIEVLNPRDRNKQVFEQIVENIKTVGLKKPITVTPRPGDDGGEKYVLVCGEGRLKAFMALGETTIAALVVDVSDEDAFIMSMVENMDVMPGEPTARVVVNAKTGTVVISRNVRVTAAAVTHGSISVSIAATNEVSQPGAFSQGQTAAVQNAEVTVSESNKPMFLFQPGVDLRQIVDAVNQVGASPSSLIAILEALKSSGSLRAELIVI